VLRAGASHALDLDPDTCCVLIYVELFHLYPCACHALVAEAKGGDIFGKGFDEVDVAARDHGPHAIDDMFVRNDVFNAIAERAGVFTDPKLRVDAYTLRAGFLMGMNADAARQDEIANENPPIGKRWLG
jgi:hypothetical protein